MTSEQLLDELEIPYITNGHHHCTPGWLQLPYCPECSPPHVTNYRLGMAVNGRMFHCWVCGKINGAEALSTLSGKPIGEIYSLLRDVSPIWTGEWHKEKPRGKFTPPERLRELLPAHRDYLASRGIDPDEAAEVWGAKGIGAAPRLSWRVWLPIYNGTKPVSWTTRAIGKYNTPRYVTAAPHEEEVNHKHLLFR